METSPQVENGFTRIANELLEAMVRANFNGREWKLILAIIRKTYGFGKKSDRISYSQITELTGIEKQHINFVMKSLIRKNIIIRTKLDRAKGFEIRIQKYYSEWACGNSYKEWLQSSSDVGVTKSGYKELPMLITKESPVQATTKERKENLTKNMSHSESMSGLIAEFISDWNTIITSTRISKIRQIKGGKRFTQLKARLKDIYFLEYYREGLKKVNVDWFCNGEGNRGWTAHVEWFCRPGKLEEIMEWSESKKKFNADSNADNNLIEPNRTHVNY